MRTLRLHRAGDLRLHEEPDPEPQPGEVLVSIRGVGLCGSDRHWFLEGGIGDAVLAAPLVLGHEFAGVVVEGPRAGERVVLDPAVPCGRCALCESGQGHLCREMRFAGHGATDGALRTLVAWPGHLAHELPDAVGDEAAPLLEPLGVALHALDLGGAERGTTAAVVGCGPLGLLLVQALRAAGVRVEYATDPLVSSDIIGNPHSCIFMPDQTLVIDNLVKVIGWYDNEWGYSNRTAELMTRMASL